MRSNIDLGMHRGALLSYLMADPELSLQSIVVLVVLIGKRKSKARCGRNPTAVGGLDAR